MSKIKVVRASGNPIEQVHIEEFHKLHAEIYDKVIKKYVKDPNKSLDPALSERISKIFDFINKRIFLKKFPYETEWDLLDSEEKILEKIEKYGNIVLSKSNDKLIYVILDIEV